MAAVALKVGQGMVWGARCGWDCATGCAGVGTARDPNVPGGADGLVLHLCGGRRPALH